MGKPTFTWHQTSPSELAQFVQTELPDAFRLPSDVNRLDLLAAHGNRGLVEMLYQGLVECGLNYDLAPFEPRQGVIQQIRKPQTMLDEQRGTCLDLAVVMAGMCLANELLPLIIVLDGHALLAVSLTNTRRDADAAAGLGAFQQGILTDFETIRGWAEDGDEYLFLECTGAARSRGGLSAAVPEGQGRNPRGVMPFARACAAGAEQITLFAAPQDALLGANQRAFLYALHIHELQVRYGLTPLGDDEGPVALPAPGVTRTQTVEGGAKVGVAVNGDVHGGISLTQQSGGINLGSGNSIGSIGEIVGGDKVAGDRVMGDKVINYGAPAPATDDPSHIQRLIDLNTRRLQVLEEQAAFAGYGARPEILIEIEDIRREIARLKELL